MRKRLLDKFMGNYGWALIWLLSTTYALAGSYPYADTCQHPDPPVITGSAKEICRSQTVTLKATGCSGTVVWSTGEIGNTISVQPQQTTKYTAICRAQPGCISCFAEVWTVVVNTPNAPVITPSSQLVCANDAITLTATGCSGTVRWPDQSTGLTWVGRLQQTTTFQATCEQKGCVSNESVGVTVQVDAPTTPRVSVDKDETCPGKSVQLIASNCLGRVRWSDGGEGLVRTVTPGKTISYRAVCQVGSCQSDSSESIQVNVHTNVARSDLITKVTNGCPFQTADLTKAVPGAGGYYVFRMEASIDADAVQSPWAVGAGTYYVFERTSDGCYTDPVAVTATISSCQNAIAPCVSNPPTVTARVDSLNWAKGVVQLRGQLGGSATKASWQSEGGGLFTNADLNARYILSEMDRQQGKAIFTLIASDPDGHGPCQGASTQLVVLAPAKSEEVIGLSKEVSAPTWLVEGNNQLVEVTYRLTAQNLGKNVVTNLQVSDNLEAAFSVHGALIQSVRVKADSNLVVNPAYTGRGADTTLLLAGHLLPGSRGHMWLTVRLDVSQASTLTFANRAIAEALDANGSICRDRSTTGVEADPDKNGNPADNDEPTLITLQSLRPETDETVFIPEGFSPNGDGINDLFIIRGVPVGITVQIQVFNKLGHLVYQNTNYKSDWDGTSNVGSIVTGTKQGLPDGTYYYQVRLSDGREFIRFMTIAR